MTRSEIERFLCELGIKSGKLLVSKKHAREVAHLIQSDLNRLAETKGHFEIMIIPAIQTPEGRLWEFPQKELARRCFGGEFYFALYVKIITYEEKGRVSSRVGDLSLYYGTPPNADEDEEEGAGQERDVAEKDKDENSSNCVWDYDENTVEKFVDNDSKATRAVAPREALLNETESEQFLREIFGKNLPPGTS